MLDLFNTAVLPGLAATSDFVTGMEEQALIAAIDGADLSPFRFQGWTGKRWTPPPASTIRCHSARVSHLG